MPTEYRDAELVPAEFYLGQNYPNPFREKTTIKYCLASKAKVALTVYDPEGRVVKRLVDGEEEAGTHEAVWEAKGVPHGIYKYEMKAAEYKSTKEMELKK